MTRPASTHVCLALFAAAGLTATAAVQAAGASEAAPSSGVYYQCPGNVFTNTITQKEAESRGCKSREAAQPTTIPAPKVRATPAGRGTDPKVEAGDQKARDSDARKILEAELQKSEAQLEVLKKEYNNGEAERRGDEHNYQKYVDRLAELKASIARTEADVAALRRELAKTQ